MVVASASALLASPATAVTRVAKTTYTSDATWTAGSSPYVLDGDVTIAQSATLTIEPGVVVKLNGQYRMLRVQGRLAAFGTPQQRVIFTSIQDDSVGGDSGGDGVTFGVKGQWRQIYATAGGSVDLNYATVRYGGYDCCGASTNFGVVYAYGGGSVAADQTLFVDNQHSAVRVAASCTAGCSPKATITNSVITRNGGGVSTLNAAADVRDSRIRENDGRGVNYMLSAGYSYPSSQLTDNDITRNGSYGVFFWIEKGVPSALWPQGQRNNIWDNAVNEATKVELWSLDPRRDIDWTGNFWGSSVEFRDNAAGCESAAPAAAGRLVYEFGGISAAGPFRSRAYVGKTAAGKDVLCYYDYIRVERDQFSRTYIPHSGGPAPSTDPIARALLQRHLPILRYDSGERFHVLSPAALTDFYVPGGDLGDRENSNALQDAEGAFVRANPEFGSAPLTLSYLQPTYPSDPWTRRAGTASEVTDEVSARGNADDGFYEGDARTMEGRTGYPYKVYGRAARGSDGKLWLQYWFFYYFNPDPFALFDLVHEGDWEMVQVGLRPDGTPEDAVYSQHNTQQRCDWASVERSDELPVVYVAEHSHASYFGPDRIPLPYDAYDSADGQGGGLFAGELEQISDANPAWVGWRGQWGDSGGSPQGPRFQPGEKWSDPSGWAAQAGEC